MIVFVLTLQVCWTVWNCEWRSVGAFVAENECLQIGQDYARDSTVRDYKCVVTMRDTKRY